MIGDARHLPLKDDSVDCVITSPPYWSLRKYSIPDLIWDDGWTGQLGLEPTIELYLKHLLQCFDEIKRVLKPTGTCWVNLGDSYSGGNKNRQTGRNDTNDPTSTNFGGWNNWDGGKQIIDVDCSIPPKSLCLIPYRFAIEMVNRGWILRNIVVWAKPNCMPSSVKDRFTCDFEPVFFFTKSRKYWFEQQYEPHLNIEKVQKELNRQFRKRNSPELRQGGPLENYTIKWKGGNPNANINGRNRRCVWTIPTQPYPEFHFATFPEALVEPMIRAGCPKEICVKCGKAREKIVEKEMAPPEVFTKTKKTEDCMRLSGKEIKGCGQKLQNWRNEHPVIEKGFTDCGCDAGFRPGIVLDPFAGTGTVMRVAEKLGRVGIGFDLAYEELQEKRLKNIQKEMF